MFKTALLVALSAALAGSLQAGPPVSQTPTDPAQASSDDVRQISFGGSRFDPMDPTYKPRAATKSAKGSTLRLVQFNDTPLDRWRTALEARGMRVIQYYPHNAYLVWADDTAANRAESLSYVRWQGTFSPDWKLSTELKGRLGLLNNVQILIYDDGSLSNVLAQIEGLGGVVQSNAAAQPDGALISAIVKIDAGQLALVNALPQVLWTEFVSPKPKFDDEISSQITAGNYNGTGQVTGTGYIPFIANLGLTGAGVIWAVTDSGIDYDNPELTAKIVGGYDFPGCPVVANKPGTDNSGGGHGTHVAGIIAGRGLVGTASTDANGYHYGIGIAPQTNLVALNPICIGAVPWPPVGGWQENSKRAIGLNAIGTNNSWTSGEGTGIGYNATARTHDFMIRDGNFDTPTVNDQFMIVFSAGNSGPGASSITSPKEAKNPIVVGASQNQRVGSIDALATFSSRGPAIDGRTVPTITTPGEQIASTRRVAGGANCATAIPGTNNNYAFCSGTSMASPQAAGAASLLTQWWRGNNAGATPSPAMIKALLVNGAVDMTGPAPIPNNDEGWGRVQLQRSIGVGLTSVYVDQSERLDNVGEVFERSYGVPSGTAPVRITLTWTDAPGAAGANPALVNNLDLEVIVNGTTYRGNAFTAGQSSAGGTADIRNNIENVFLPAGTGAVTIRVKATTLPGDGVPNAGDTTDQDFALVCSNCAAEPGFTVSMSTAQESICVGAPVQRVISMGQILGFNSPVTMSSTGLPAPGTVGFTPNPVTSFPSSVAMNVQTTGVAGGQYTVVATGTSGAVSRSSSFPLFVATAAPAASTLTTPANAATNVAANASFVWTASAQAFDYEVQVATDSNFANIVRTTITRATTWTPSPALDTSTQYYWRVISRNACGAQVPEMFANGFEDGVGGSGSTNSATGAFLTVSAPGDCPVGPAPTLVLTEDFESGAAGWGQEAGGNGTNTWAITTDSPFAGARALRGLTPSVATDQRFISPSVTLPTVGQGLTLAFQSQQSMESRTAGGCYDGGFIEVSVNGGPYAQITAGLLTDPYNGALQSGNPAAPAPAWCGDPQAYLKSVIDLAPYAGMSVRFRFRVTSDPSVNRVEGWNIDNVEIKRCN